MEYHPEHQRAPQHLSFDQVRDALEELESKLDTLRRRARATAADSAHTYHAHIATLERKQQLLTEKVDTMRRQATTADQPTSGDASMWHDIKSGIDTLRQDLRHLLD